MCKIQCQPNITESEEKHRFDKTLYNRVDADDFEMDLRFTIK